MIKTHAGSETEHAITSAMVELSGGAKMKNIWFKEGFLVAALGSLRQLMWQILQVRMRD